MSPHRELPRQRHASRTPLRGTLEDSQNTLSHEVSWLQSVIKDRTMDWPGLRLRESLHDLRIVPEFLAGDGVKFAGAGDETILFLDRIGQADAETVRLRRQHVTVLHLKRIANNLGVQRGRIRREFEDAGIGGGKPAMDVLHQRAAGTPDRK